MSVRTGVATGGHCFFAPSGFAPAGLRPGAAPLRHGGRCAARRASLQHGALSRTVMYEGEVATWIKRNFGETFFLGGTYTSEDKQKTKEWDYKRTWTDFLKLDRALRKAYPDQIPKLPPKPYLVGEEVGPLGRARSAESARERERERKER